MTPCGLFSPIIFGVHGEPYPVPFPRVGGFVDWVWWFRPPGIDWLVGWLVSLGEILRIPFLSRSSVDAVECAILVAAVMGICWL